MINKITIKSHPCFSEGEGNSFVPTRVNYIFGSNGTGKTTISNILKEKKEECVEIDTSNELKMLVYNKSFVGENFGQYLKGIFVLGKNNKEINEKIAENNEKVNRHRTQSAGYEGAKSTYKIQYEKQKSDYAEIFWATYTKYKDEFSRVFKDLGKKVKFKDKLMYEYKNNVEEITTIENLRADYTLLYDEDKKSIPLPKVIQKFDIRSLENNVIFEKSIIGKSNVNMSRIVEKLNNSDWVKHGLQYLQESDHTCPFCQHDTITDSIRKELNQIFDESYNEQINELANVSTEYDNTCREILQGIEANLKLDNTNLINKNLEGLYRSIHSAVELNKVEIENKKRNPSTVISLKSITSDFEKVLEIITQAIHSTEESNNRLRNLSSERERLNSRVWKFLTVENRTSCVQYVDIEDKETKAMRGMDDRISVQREAISKLENENSELTKQASNAQETVESINRTLEGYGFTNFKLVETNGNLYRIVRNNGEDANSTLSEGEKTFLTFLYYFHLIQGAFLTEDISIDRILVIDDPISSLDSTVLNIVSSIVRGIISDSRENRNSVKQVFILTHNVYFHNEITFKKRGEKTQGNSFWIIKKSGNISRICSHGATNPIRSSYELLWEEIRDITKINRTTLPNVLRRILEYYFKFLGNIEPITLIDNFQSEDKATAQSLLLWINSDSHTISDDIYYTSDDTTSEKYLYVFKKFFEYEGHGAHYEMMMGNSESYS